MNTKEPSWHNCYMCRDCGECKRPLRDGRCTYEAAKLVAMKRKENDQKPATYTVYGLIDPRTEEIRYVGCTRQTLLKRLYGHLNDGGGEKQQWVDEVRDSGREPQIRAIAVYSAMNYQDAVAAYQHEAELIRTIPNLLNKQPGSMRRA